MHDPTQDSRNTRERILDAALDLFAIKGYHDTRMDEIVAESQTSKGSIYFHFPNKEQLFLALVDQFANLLEKRVSAAIENEEKGIARVQAALTTCLETFGKYRRPAKILLVQAVGLGKPFEEKRLQVNDRFAHLIEIHIQEAIERREIEPVDSEVVSYAWMGAIYGVIIRWVYTGEPDQERIVAGLLPLLLKSVGYE